MRSCHALGLVILVMPLMSVAAPGASRDEVASRVTADYPALEKLYYHFHANPELSLMEEKTAARMAAELRAAGCQVTEKFGGHGVVGILDNGVGPTLLLRADMDGLPVLEETGLAYASKARSRDASGADVPIMHACGHDFHLTALIGAARQLAATKDRWKGKLIFVAQPAEEIGMGARAMLTAGLYRTFGKPDWAVALHDSATLPAGTIGFIEGFAMANVDTLDIVVRGVGGHGAYPNTTRDPVVLAARIVLTLQTLVSRETRPIDPAVITVGSIAGGTKHNVIPNEVKLQLTVRSYSDGVRRRLLESIERVCRGEAIAAGMPEDRMPLVTQVNSATATPALYNDPALVRRLRETLKGWMGADRVATIEPEMGGEDFGQFGRTTDKVPLCLFRVGVVDPAKVAESERTGLPLPSLHSSRFAPVPEPSIKAAVTAMTAVALDLLASGR